MPDSQHVAATVFLSTIVMTYAAAIAARLRTKIDDPEDEHLAGRKLNRWLIGLSAGTTGNSGFIVTGAVGLGYAGGLHWLALPVAWFLGDLVFWAIFPSRLNLVARATRSTTISDILTQGIDNIYGSLITISASLLLCFFLSTYTSAQWLAGQKFLSGSFGLSGNTALVMFALTIVGYSSFGGFRGSVYTDTFQAIIRISGTIIAIALVSFEAMQDTKQFYHNIAQADSSYFRLFPSGWIAGIGFVLGWAMAAIGFGLGQPQIVSRYLAGATPEETKAARWIYISFIQFTWISMTGFGILLRGVMPGIDDPETGLSVFFQSNMPPLITGFIFADVFATIASTSNGILVSISQMIYIDILKKKLGSIINERTAVACISLSIGIITIFMCNILPGNVFTIAADAISKIGAGLAGPVMIKVLKWQHDGLSLLVALIVGIVSAFAWSLVGLNSFLNEAGVGIAASLAVNFIMFRCRRV